MKLLLNNLETLYTNVDGSDVKQEYLKRAENVRLRNGYVISEGLKFTPMSKPEGEVLWLDAVEFDEDRLKTKVIDGKIVEDYTQNIINSENIIKTLLY